MEGMEEKEGKGGEGKKRRNTVGHNIKSSVSTIDSDCDYRNAVLFIETFKQFIEKPANILIKMKFANIKNKIQHKNKDKESRLTVFPHPKLEVRVCHCPQE